MRDFYARKLGAMKMAEDLIKQVTKSGAKAKASELLNEVHRNTGFNRVIERHLKELISIGNVKQSYSESGECLLEWVEQ